MPLINCKINLTLTWSSTCVITSSTSVEIFKRVISWNKYLSKPELLAQNPNLNHLVEPSFQGVN